MPRRLVHRHSYGLVECHRPDLLILDIRFDGVKSGWRLLDQLGRNPHTARIPVILCTADARVLESQRAALVERGIRCLAKPFDVADLLGLVRDGLRDAVPPVTSSAFVHSSGSLLTAHLAASD